VSDLHVHLGCGKSRLPGFIHVDARSDVGADHVAPADNLPFLDNSVSLLYWCHGLEHIKYLDLPRTLNEWRRVLMPGGTLRLAVPDFAILCDLYRKGVPLTLIRGAINGGQEYPENIHYSTWDFSSLRDLLHKHHFRNVRRYDAHAVLPPSYYFDWSIGRIAGRYISLNVEADV
jgi:predicted SAM-dependent methyltransferase